jgi:predicted acylesterase/phospholipase RssA
MSVVKFSGDELAQKTGLFSKIKSTLQRTKAPELGYFGSLIQVNPEYIDHYNLSADFFNYSDIPLSPSSNLEIEGLCFGGRASLGLQYGGAIRALSETGVLSRIQRIHGVSAGAITATLLGTIINQPFYIREEYLRRLEQILNTIDFKLFFDHNYYAKVIKYLNMHYKLGEYDLGAAFEGVSETAKTALSINISTLLVALLGAGISATGVGIPVGVATVLLKIALAKYLDKASEDADISKGDQFLWWMRNTLKEFLQFDPTKKQEITFEDYYNFTGIDLSISSVNVKTGVPMIFSAKTTPTVEVAEAVLAAIGYRGSFRPVTLMVNEASQTTNSFSEQEYLGGDLSWSDLTEFDVYDKNGDLWALDTKVINLIPKGIEDQLTDPSQKRSSLYSVLSGDQKMDSHFWSRSCFLDLFASSTGDSDGEVENIIGSLSTININRDQYKQINDNRGLFVKRNEFSVEDYKKRILNEKTYNQIKRYLDWVLTRMGELDRAYPSDRYLLSVQYREKTLFPTLTEEQKNQIWKNPSELGFTDRYGKTDDLVLQADLENSKKTLYELYDFAQPIPIKDILESIKACVQNNNELRNSLNSMEFTLRTLPTRMESTISNLNLKADKKSKKAEFDQELHNMEIVHTEIFNRLTESETELKDLIDNIDLIHYRESLLDYRSLMSHFNKPFEFNEEGHPIVDITISARQDFNNTTIENEKTQQDQTMARRDQQTQQSRQSSQWTQQSQQTQQPRQGFQQTQQASQQSQQSQQGFQQPRQGSQQTQQASQQSQQGFQQTRQGPQQTQQGFQQARQGSQLSQQAQQSSQQWPQQARQTQQGRQDSQLTR